MQRIRVRTRVGMAIFVAGTCLGILLGVLGWAAPGHAQAKVGDPALGFALPTLKGGEVSLASFRGKRSVLLVFSRGWVGYW